jgi:RimJ/RimL family protein N-acetyltransferase
MLIKETERLTIRQFELGDCDFIIRLLNEPSFIENIADKGVRNREQATTYLNDGPLKAYREQGHGLYLVSLRNSGQPIGMCGLIKRDCFQEVDLGYAYLPQFTGQGYAQESGRAVLEYGAQVLGLKTVIAIVQPANKPSTTLLERLGFTQVDTVILPPPCSTDLLARYRLILPVLPMPDPAPR